MSVWHDSISIAMWKSRLLRPCRKIRYITLLQVRKSKGKSKRNDTSDVEDDDFEDACEQVDVTEEHERHSTEWQEKHFETNDSAKIMITDDQNGDLDITQSEVDPIMAHPAHEPLEEIRVFAGNIGQDPLFHTFRIPASCTAEELVQQAVARFDIPSYTAAGEEGTIEYYLAVQGTDGDDCILSSQDKPLSIFKTLTDSLTTPMPSTVHIHHLSQQAAARSDQGTPVIRRARSSSFGNHEPTLHDEDSMIRFYLHRRIKRAHEREGLIYIKVSLYPDDGSTTYAPSGNANAGSAHSLDGFTTNPTPATGKKKKLVSTHSDIDRIDKIIPVRQESCVGMVINTALGKFHVPDAEAYGYETTTSNSQWAKYRMSVRCGGKETNLHPHDTMGTVLQQQRSCSLPNGPVTSDLLFIIRRVYQMTSQDEQSQRSRQGKKKKHQPPTLIGVGNNHGIHPHLSYKGHRDPSEPSEQHLGAPLPNGDRRPSIIDILMVSPHPEDQRPSVLFHSHPRAEDRRVSATNMSTERKSSLIQPGSLSPTQGQQAFSSRKTQASSSSSLNGGLSPPSSIAHRYSSINSSLDDRLGSDISIDSTMDKTSNLSVYSPTSPGPLDESRKKDAALPSSTPSSFRQQLKKLMGWGAKPKKPTSSPLLSPSPSPSHQIHPLQPQAGSSFVSSTITVSTRGVDTPGTDYGSLTSTSCTPLPAVAINSPSTNLIPSPSSQQVRHGSVGQLILSSETPELRRPSDTRTTMSELGPPTRRLSSLSRAISTASISDSDSDTDDNESLSDVPPDAATNIQIDEDDDDDSLSDSSSMRSAHETNPVSTAASHRSIPPSTATPAAAPVQAPAVPISGTSTAIMPSEPVLSDIQAQYAMWIDSQQGVEEPTVHHDSSQFTGHTTSPAALSVPKLETAPSAEHSPNAALANVSKTTISSSPSSHSTASSCASAATSASSPAPSCHSHQTSKSVKTQTPSVTSVAVVAPVDISSVPHPRQEAPHPMASNNESEATELDDLFLLVTHGVDFLQQREKSKWEDDGGYQFHPWNRTDGSFAVKRQPKKVQAKHTAPQPPSEQNGTAYTPITASESNESSESLDITHLTPSTEGSTEELLSPPPTPSPQQENTQDSKKKPGVHPLLLAGATKRQPYVPQTPIAQHNETLVDEELELQRIVASHILF
ncbi:uncharacterized protein BYT42DRAFT_128875 [Radiomyces spectabilis]|uniref:uncharacterized protein n=1 Tax=Radiomyces spectabilis TaxID=64574 RepID=UPI0022203632|nr:uncharacterized protein BYT42DRAFT_128875 [Radiomyces spectabilis]KAI8367509.1 hypothetical protein BYT42DRAFT_128875 [Radiomyces spectabilis]